MLAEAGIAAPTDPRMTRVSSHEAGLPRDITKRRRTQSPSPTLAGEARGTLACLVAASAACTAWPMSNATPATCKNTWSGGNVSSNV